MPAAGDAFSSSRAQPNGTRCDCEIHRHGRGKGMTRDRLRKNKAPLSCNEEVIIKKCSHPRSPEVPCETVVAPTSAMMLLLLLRIAEPPE